ncbi:hypothetical protein TNCV_2626901 [Trichonephila clavipes]|uniref:Uncharacterized protein n=1 Tax=Trichonephila clavipes TaxID=2585209 RepID=A0A8X7BFJ9_TRICX|nr:hypothetical protein TNCV_2626901 [Trichonephila clavipes]
MTLTLFRYGTEGFLKTQFPSDTQRIIVRVDLEMKQVKKQARHEFELSAVRSAKAQSPHVGVVWKLRDCGAGSCVVLII